METGNREMASFISPLSNLFFQFMQASDATNKIYSFVCSLVFDAQYGVK